MDMMSALTEAGGLDAIARELDVDQSTAQTGVNALLPAILDGFRGQAQASPQGMGGLGAILSSLGGGGLLGNVLAPEATDVGQGNDVLGQIFGSKDTSRAVAQHASAQSGISPELLKKMLPIVAMLVAGYLSKQNQAAPASTSLPGSSDGGLLGSLIGAATGGSSGGLLGSIISGMTKR